MSTLSLRWLLLISSFGLASIHALTSVEKLTGLGYREQELQQSKGQNFINEVPNGIPAASFGGGTHIFIEGDGLAFDSETNIIHMYSYDLNATAVAPGLSEED